MNWFKSFPSRPPVTLSYGVAVLSVAISTLILLLVPARQDDAMQVSLFLCAVMFSAWFGGVGPGSCATVLSVLSLDYFFLPPTNSFAVDISNLLRLIFFASIGFIVVYLIASQKRSTELLKQSEDHLRRVVDSTPVMIWSAEPDGAVDFVNKSWKDFTGRSFDNLNGWKWTALIHPDDAERVVDQWRKALERGEPIETEARLQRISGDYRWLLIRSVPLRDASGKITKWYGTKTDITERKQAEELLRETDTKLNEAQQLSKIGYWERDLVADRITWSEGTWRIFGVEPSNGVLSQAQLQEFVHPDDRQLQQHAFNEALQGSQLYDVEYRIFRPDGDVRFVHVRDQIVYDKTGKPVRMFGVVQDITERKRAEQAIRESEERYRALFTFSPDAIYVHGEEKVTLVNPAMCQLLGANEPSQLIGKSVFEIVHLQYHEKMRERWKVVFGGQPAPLLEEKFIRLDGTVVDVEVSAVAIDWHGSKRVQVMVRDITERKRMEEALRQSEANFRTLAEQSLQGIAIYQGENVVYANPASSAILGYTIEEIKSMSPDQLAALVHPLDRAFAEGHVVKRLAGEEGALWVEWRMVHKDGSMRWIQACNNAIEYNGQPALLSMTLDITERKQKDEALRQSEFDLAEAQRVARFGSWNLDLASNSFRVSEELGRIFDIERTDLGVTYDTYLSRVYPDDRPFVLKVAAEARSSGKPYQAEYRITTRSGEVKHINVVGHARKGLGGAISGLFGTVQDITERKRSEKALLESEERYRALFASAFDGLCVVVDDKVTMANPAFCQLTGVDEPSQIVGTPIFNLVHPENQEAMRKRGDLVRRGLPVPLYEETFVRPDGSTVEVEVSSAPIDWQGSKGAQVVARDISERKKAESALKASMEQLHVLARRLETIREDEKETIAREIHDEFGQALTAIRMSLSLLSERIQSGEKLSQESIQAELRSSINLIDRAFQSIQTIVTELRPWVLDSLDLNGAIQWQAREFGAHTGINCEVNSTLENTQIGRESTTAIFRIFQETLTNIARHAKTKKVDVVLKTEHDNLILGVKDYGIGISEEKAKAPESLGIQGMKERALSLGGDLQIRGIEDGGTIVTLKVPMFRLPDKTVDNARKEVK